MEKISIIVPCYNEEDVLNMFYEEISKVTQDMRQLTFELIFIDDGSKDNTLNIIKNLRDIDKRIRYISFSRNFGKEAGMLAGLEASTGDFVVIVDADLQHPPMYIKDMYKYIKQEKYDCVSMLRSSRKGESIIRSFFAKMYYKIANKLLKINLIEGATDFRLMTRQMVNSILELKEYNRFSKGIFSWVGFNTKWIEYENVERIAGQTKWSFGKLFAYSIESFVAFSTVPLLLPFLVSIVFGIISFVLLILIIISLIIYSSCHSLLIISFILFFLSSSQLLCMGILSEYLSKSYLEIKKRPIYIVKETENLK